MYDMYPWDSDSQGDYPPEPLRSWRHPNPRDTSRETSRDTSPAQAVQTALDRRDNGGAAAASHGGATAVAHGDAAASHNAGPRATPPTTSLTRQ